MRNTQLDFTQPQREEVYVFDQNEDHNFDFQSQEQPLEFKGLTEEGLSKHTMPSFTANFDFWNTIEQDSWKPS